MKNQKSFANQFVKSINSDEQELFHTIMQEINAEHKDVLTLLKYNALEKPKATQKKTEIEYSDKPNFLKNIVSVFGLTDEQKQYFITQGRNAITTLYDNIVENNLRKG